LHVWYIIESVGELYSKWEHRVEATNAKLYS